MRKYIIPLTCLLLLSMQGMAMSLLPASLVYSELLITPHWVLVYLFILTIFYDKDDTYLSVWYGLIFGLLLDIVYTGVLGVYMITYTVVVYAIHGCNRWFHSNFLAVSLLTIVGISLADTMIYVIYSFIQVTSMSWADYGMLRLLPTLAANMIFFTLLYPVVKGPVSRWSEEIIRP